MNRAALDVCRILGVYFHGFGNGSKRAGNGDTQAVDILGAAILFTNENSSRQFTFSSMPW
jgi:hypothetical protein